MNDVVVVGGNLSGASAAINASKMGAKVTLIEKNLEPFFPPHCGEGTDGITVDLLDLENIGCYKNEIRRFTLNVSGKKEFVLKLNKKLLFIIDRNFVEKHLIKSAEKAGVNVKKGIRMKKFIAPNDIILDNKEKIQGKVIIDATGINCQIGKQIGLDTTIQPKHIGVCIQSRVEGEFEIDNMKMWFHKPYAPFGYAWTFPIKNNLANIGIGIPGGQKYDLKKLHDNYITNQLRGDYKIITTFRSCVPASKVLNQMVKDNVMIVGDAARLVNPIFENGINNAIFSGSVAGILAARYTKGEISTLKIYEQLLNKKVKRINRAYKRKEKLTTEEKFVKSYIRGLTFINFLNKISPNIFQKLLLNIVKKDRDLINSIK